ncbi:RHS repeat-associated core domain-containing protein, partial [bacterium]|nr:RHS repeat-associated core domain-containing protein [bacterium]
LRQTVGASWDALGRMTTFVEGDPKTELGAPAETYRYAADGFRWLRAGADGKATLTLRDAQGRPLAEYVVARGALGPTLSREYVHALGQVVAERTWTGGTQTTTYHHRDHLGSLRVATDAAGAHADAHDYYPFGGEMGPVASSSRKKFTGHERDEETGLDYMLARYHSPALGRFLSVDPGMDVQPENPQSWNVYNYVRNNPVNGTDPDGKVRKDKDGNVLFWNDGMSFERRKWTFDLPGGAKVLIEFRVRLGHIEADDGTAIVASQVAGKPRVTLSAPGEETATGDMSLLPGWDVSTNCIGTAFADGQVWIQPDQVPALISHDGYVETQSPAVGDVGVYREGSSAKHAVQVTGVSDAGAVTAVRSKNGGTPVVTAPPGPGPGTAWPVEGAEPPSYYTKPKEKKQ